MRDEMYIGSSPIDEKCAQLGTDGYWEKAQKECRAFINQLRRVFGKEPGSARLIIKRNPHDFGTYLSVNCYYNDGDEEALDYALRCEGETPENWDDEAREELGLEKEKV